MFTLEINEKEYNFSFGMGFVRDINETVKTPVEGVPGVFTKRGLNYAIGSIIDGDIEVLEDVLLMASKSAPTSDKLTRKELDAHLESPETDIDALFEKVLDFFDKSNCTGRQTREMLQAVEEAKKKA